MSGVRDERLLVYGAGAVGQFVGASLARAGHDVTLLARPRVAAVVAGKPLVVAEPGGTCRAVPLAAVSNIADLAALPTLVLLTVKSFDTRDALDDLARLVAGGAQVLTLQNGVGNEEALIGAVGREAVRSGAFTVSVSAPRPGLVRAHTTRGGFGLAPIHGESIASELALLSSTGLPVTVARSHRVLKWSKLLLNLLANAQAALLDRPPGALFASAHSFAVEQAAFREARAVMRAAGIGTTDLPAYPVRLLVAAIALPAPLARRLLARRVGGGRGDKLPSLAADLRAGRGQSEVGWLNGAVAREGARVGVATPVNAALTRMLKAAAADVAEATRFAGQPRQLAAALLEPDSGVQRLVR